MPLVPLFRNAARPKGRIAVTPDDPDAVTARPPGKNGKASRRPHTTPRCCRCAT
jgi:hypothetical protein